MPIHLIQISETDLASRQAAAILRVDIERHIQVDEQVSIDLGAVLSISESYADELFGVLAVRYGLDRLTRCLVIFRASPMVFKAIAAAIRQRLTTGNPENLESALAAARNALVHRQPTNM